MRLRHLFVSRGHNYFGRRGQRAGVHSVEEVDQVACVAGRGIRGDRFFDFKEDCKGQITFFAWEVLVAMRDELNLPDAEPSGFRRNVITEAVDVAAWIGKEFAIQGVRFAGVEECRPCEWMNAAFGHDGVEGWLRGRGGLRARILSDGMLRREG